MPPKSTSKKKSTEPEEEQELSEVNHNEDITKMLKVILDYFTRQKDWMRVRAYKSAVDSLSTYHKRVESGKEAQKLSGIGAGIAKKIDEYVNTGKCALYDEIMQDPATAAMLELQRVQGIGASKASELAESGVTSLEQLNKPEYYGNLTHQQKVGLKYVRELEEPIPKEEGEEIYGEVEKVAKSLGMETKLVGAFRRGRPTADNVDIIFRHKDYTAEDPDKVTQHAKTKSCPGPDLLRKLVDSLKEKKLLTEDLTELSDKGLTTYRGICLAPSQRKKAPQKSDGSESTEKQAKPTKQDVAADIDISDDADKEASQETPAKKESQKTQEPAPAAPAVTGLSVPSLEEMEEQEDNSAGKVPSMWERGNLAAARGQEGTTSLKRKPSSGPSIEVMDPEEMEAKKRKVQNDASEEKEKPLTGPIHRMLILKIIPYNFWWPSVLYSTGPDMFLSSIRSSAKKKGYVLNAYALRKELGQWTQGEIEKAIEEGTMKKRGAPKAGDAKMDDPEPLSSEEDIFNKIGMTYRPPEKRG